MERKVVAFAEIILQLTSIAEIIFEAVDIFYPELSYEEIEQNVAFEFLSLLSEIGGFLGLLLGESVLTVCELIDFVALATINKFKRNMVMPRL